MDAWLIRFVGDNWITLTVVFGVLKVLAKKTPWAGDDEIIQMLFGWMNRVKGGQTVADPSDELAD